MNVGTLIQIALLCALPLSAAGAGEPACQLCAAVPADAKKPLRPLAISIDAALDFSKSVYKGRGPGIIMLDARSGRQQMVGLMAIGGPAFAGTVTITGEPLARIEVDMPRTAVLVSNLGGTAELTDIRTDLPPHPMLGADGRLVFSFGARLTVRNGADGDFRGRIPVTVNYN